MAVLGTRQPGRAPGGRQPGGAPGERRQGDRARGAGASYLARCLAPLAAAVAGCASLAPLPDRPEPIPYADTLPIPEPGERSPVEAAEFVEMALVEEVGRVVDTRHWAGKGREALNLTHFDEVVSSAWFEHRNGRRRMSPEEVQRAPGRLPPPDTSRPITVTAGKPAGVMPGFFVRDARGDRYLLKFDPKGSLRLASSADVVVARILWAAGYHVPADHIIVFDPDRLVLDPDATITIEGRPRPMTRADVEAILARTDRLPDGRYLGLASRFVPGVPKGPFAFEGTRRDDPNDHYDHEYRREIRGLFVLAAWLNHIDLRPGNTLDAYIDPPGYLRHYLIDFASALGSGGIAPHSPREGREHNFDFWPTMGRLFTLGFYKVGWEDEEGGEIHPSIGWMPVETYDPGAWKPNWPSPPWRLMTPADGYWGAKLVASFSDEQLRAAVEAASLPAAPGETLVSLLAHRRDRTVEHWYRRVAPVEAPALVARAGSTPRPGFRLSFRDLGLEAGVRRADDTRYRWELVDKAHGVRASGEAPAATGELQVLEIPSRAGPSRRSAGNGRGPDPGGSDGGRPARLRIRVLERGRELGRPATVFLRWRDGAYAVAGLLH